MRQWLQGLQARERAVLGFGLALLLVVLGYSLVWQPLQIQRERLRLRLADQQQLMSWMQGAAAEIRRLRAQGQATEGNPTGSLAARVEARLSEAGLKPQLARIEPDGQGSLRLQFESVDFARLLTALQGLIEQDGLSIDEANFARGTDQPPGRVDARIRLGGPAGS